MFAKPAVRRVVYYGIPILFCLAVHSLALRTWFWLDDFAWLGLRLEIHSPADLFGVLFRPEAQGTVRTLSERLFFLVFSSIFGVEALPSRLWEFLTQFANIVLLIQIARRLTGSTAAGFLAGLLWSANAGLAIPLGWTAAYNQIAFAFFILLAFRLFLAYIDTGERKYWIWQWIAFLLGFGALELNVVYPALAAGYALCCARKYFRQTIYLFVPSIVYAGAHFALIPPSTDPSYRMYFGVNLVTSLWKYWAFAVAALRDAPMDWRPMWLGRALLAAISLALTLFIARKLRLREALVVFTMAWFFLVILPVLPLKNHFTEYYVTVPSIGIAILAAWALSETRGVSAALATPLVGLYLVVSIVDTRSAEKFYYDLSARCKQMFRTLKSLPKTEASKAILFENVDNLTFWLGFYPDPFRLIGIQRVYLVPDSQQTIDPHPEFGDVSRFVIAPGEALRLLRIHQAIVFAFEETRLRDVTQRYTADVLAKYVAQHPEFVDVGDPAYASRLGPTWYQIEEEFRWMPARATVVLGGPNRAGQVLKITGYCASFIAKGLEVSFRADGIALGSRSLTKLAGQRFSFELPLPVQLVGKENIEIQIEVNRTAQVPGDRRRLGLIFGTFAVQ